MKILNRFEAFCLPSLTGNDEDILSDVSRGRFVIKVIDGKRIIIINAASDDDELNKLRHEFFDKYIELRMSLATGSEESSEDKPANVQTLGRDQKVVQLAMEIPEDIHSYIMRLVCWSDTPIMLATSRDKNDTMVFKGTRKQLCEIISDIHLKTMDHVIRRLEGQFDIGEFLTKFALIKIFSDFPTVGMRLSDVDGSIKLDGSKSEVDGTLAMSKRNGMTSTFHQESINSQSRNRKLITSSTDILDIINKLKCTGNSGTSQTSGDDNDLHNIRSIKVIGVRGDDQNETIINHTPRPKKIEVILTPSRSINQCDQYPEYTFQSSNQGSYPPQLTPQLISPPSPHPATPFTPITNLPLHHRQFSFLLPNSSSSNVSLTPPQNHEFSTNSGGSLSLESSSSSSSPSSLPPSSLRFASSSPFVEKQTDFSTSRANNHHHHHQFNVVKIIQPMHPIDVMWTNNQFVDNHYHPHHHYQQQHAIYEDEFKLKQHQQPPEEVTEYIRLDPSYGAKVLGKNNFVLKKLSRTIGTSLYLQEPDIVMVTGRKDKVIQTKMEIERLVEEAISSVLITFDIEHRFHSRMIGVKGRFVQKMMSDFGVDVKFADRLAPNPHLVSITGLPQKVFDCKKYIQSIVQQFRINESMSNYNYPFMSFPNTFHPSFYSN